MTGEVLGWIIVGTWMAVLTFRCISLERQRDGWRRVAGNWRRAYFIATTGAVPEGCAVHPPGSHEDDRE